MIKFIFPMLATIFLCAEAFAARTKIVHMGRSFTVVTPQSPQMKNYPLLVLLHGCTQNSDLFVDGTNIEWFAEKYKFVVLAPEQPSFANVDKCWNWFLDIQQRRIINNEMGQIISAVDLLINRFQLDPARVYAAGLSAGGALAHNLTACYPDVFSGTAIHSGLAFKTAETISEAQEVLTAANQKLPSYLGRRMHECARFIPQKRLQKVMIIHGDNDTRVTALHADLISATQAVWRDYYDDNKRNNSVIGKVTVNEESYPSGYFVTQTDIHYPKFHERTLLVKGLKHAWGGGKPLTIHFDPAAPSSTEFILSFFDLI